MLQSLINFPDADGLAVLFAANGFEHVRYIRLMGGNESEPNDFCVLFHRTGRDAPGELDERRLEENHALLNDDAQMQSAMLVGSVQFAPSIAQAITQLASLDSQDSIEITSMPASRKARCIMPPAQRTYCLSTWTSWPA